MVLAGDAHRRLAGDAHRLLGGTNLGLLGAALGARLLGQELTVALEPAAHRRPRRQHAADRERDAGRRRGVLGRRRARREPRGDERAERHEHDALRPLHGADLQIEPETFAAGARVAHHQRATGRAHHREQPPALAQVPREAGEEGELRPAIGDRVEQRAGLCLSPQRTGEAPIDEIQHTTRDVEPRAGGEVTERDRDAGAHARRKRQPRDDVGRHL